MGCQSDFRFGFLGWLSGNYRSLALIAMLVLVSIAFGTTWVRYEPVEEAGIKVYAGKVESISRSRWKTLILKIEGTEHPLVFLDEHSLDQSWASIRSSLLNKHVSVGVRQDVNEGLLQNVIGGKKLHAVTLSVEGNAVVSLKSFEEYAIRNATWSLWLAAISSVIAIFIFFGIVIGPHAGSVESGPNRGQ